MSSNSLAVGGRALLFACLSAAFVANSSAGDLEFRKVVINADSLYSAAAVFDVDHDGDLDIVGGGLWYEALAAAIVRSNQSELIEDSAHSAFADSMRGLVDNLFQKPDVR